MRPIYLRCHALIATRKVTRRFLISSDSSQEAEYHTVPIFLRTRQKWSTFTHSIRTGLSGATVVLRSRRDASDGLEEWELKPGQDRAQSKMSSPGILTHPWKMDTFEGNEWNSVAGASTTRDVKCALALDKPLPPLPDEVSSLSGDHRTIRSVQSFG